MNNFLDFSEIITEMSSLLTLAGIMWLIIGLFSIFGGDGGRGLPPLFGGLIFLFVGTQSDFLASITASIEPEAKQEVVIASTEKTQEVEDAEVEPELVAREERRDEQKEERQEESSLNPYLLESW